jgi:transposase
MIMSTARFTEEFKLEAVKQITEHQRPVADVVKRLGVSTHSLYAWVKRYGKAAEQRQQESSEAIELRRLRSEVKRLTEERDILKKAAAYFAKESG